MAAEIIPKPAVIEAGQQYHGWTVLSFSHSNKYAEKFYNCRCKCGTERLVRRSQLGKTQSCGCSRLKERKLSTGAGEVKCDGIVIGQRYRNWTVLSESNKTDAKGEKHYLCECACGKKRPVRKSAIGRNIGCGCSRNKGIASVVSPSKQRKKRITAPPAKTKKLMANPVDLMGSGSPVDHNEYDLPRPKRQTRSSKNRLRIDQRLDELALERELRNIDAYY